MENKGRGSTPTHLLPLLPITCVIQFKLNKCFVSYIFWSLFHNSTSLSLAVHAVFTPHRSPPGLNAPLALYLILFMSMEDGRWFAFGCYLLCFDRLPNLFPSSSWLFNTKIEWVDYYAHEDCLHHFYIMFLNNHVTSSDFLEIYFIYIFDWHMSSKYSVGVKMIIL